MRVEESMDLAMNNNEIIGWYDKHPPQTSSGTKIYLEALLNKNGLNDKVIKLAKSAWKECNFTEQEERVFIKRFGTYITQNDHYEKVDRLFWIRRFDEANRNIFRLDKEKQKIFRAREALIKNSPKAINLVNDLPKNYRNETGLLYEILIWHEKNENYDALNALLDKIPENPPHYHRWWEFKSRQVRTLIENGKYQTAYRLTSIHKNKELSKFAEAEWLAGWIALRYLNDPKLANLHFKNMYKVVKLPISLSRAGYWIGRSEEKLGHQEQAQKWYGIASRHFGTFYGQLSILKLNTDGKFNVMSHTEVVAEDFHNYKKNIYAKLAYIFTFHSNSMLSRQFIAKAIEFSKSKGEMVLISNLGIKIKKYDLALEAAKNASYKMVSITDICYPTINLDGCGKLEDAFVHALIRQESMFNPYAESSAGAVGLMQIMPSTGKDLASAVNTKFDHHKLKNDSKYNVKLGVHYLNQLYSKFRGSYILMAASYNAGENNVKNWIKRFGDPRKMKTVEEVVDWIELITFNETRNYVHRVLESVQIYRTIIDKSGNYKTHLDKDIKRNSPEMQASN
jgi:soluble lytic murein transglycosylase